MRCVVYVTGVRPSVHLSVPSTAAAIRSTSVGGARAQQQAGSVNAVIRGGSVSGDLLRTELVS